MSGHYFVWWSECWGGGRVWDIMETDALGYRRLVSKRPFKTEYRAKQVCAIMNQQWERYQLALAEGRAARHPAASDTLSPGGAPCP